MIDVMLAYSYQPGKVVFPATISPKLDGIRCIAVNTPTGFELWSRGKKRILSSPHIIESLNSLDLPEGWILDGELFVPGMSFQKGSGLAKRQTPSEETKQVQYFIFDLADHPIYDPHTLDYNARYEILKSLSSRDISNLDGDFSPLGSSINLVIHHQVYSDDDIQNFARRYVRLGYEGAMVRTHWFNRRKVVQRSIYENDYSRGLLKVKTFQDEEFTITGIFEEIDQAGTPKGRAAGFILSLSDSDKTFNASGLTDDVKEDVWAHPEKYIGKRATIKFFGKSEEGIPRHPNFKSLRGDE